MKTNFKKLNKSKRKTNREKKRNETSIEDKNQKS